MRPRGQPALLAAAAVAIAAILAPTPTRAQTSANTRTDYELEDILSAPFAKGLVAAPSGAAFAWIRYDRGARNVWAADAPGFVGHQLTAWTEDDGQDLGGLSFTPDGRRVVFVRGGAPNRQGEIPNPTSAPEPAERAIWIASLDGADARHVTTGSSPTISPDGARLAFLRRGQMFTLSLTDENAEAKPLLKIRGGAGSLAFSPAGDRLAFTTNRGDHGFIGVFDLAARTVTYLDPSVDRDASPVWSPDGDAIAFIRIPNESQRLPFEAVRSALPWSIRIVDLATGAGREVWRAADGPGSAFHPVSGPQLLWMDRDVLVFRGSGTAGRTSMRYGRAEAEPACLLPGTSKWRMSGSPPTTQPSISPRTRMT